LIPEEQTIMSAKPRPTAQSPTVSTPVILFGIDNHGKPKAARFGKNHADLAIKAAEQLQLRVLAATDPKVAEIASRLPMGRIHATGRMFVPFVRRDLYDKLAAVAPNGNGHSPPPPAAATAAASTEPRPSGSTPTLPEHWDKIGVGDLVVAFESPDDGWYEAIVVEANGDMFILRWRDYPRQRQITRHRNRLGLLYPGSNPPPQNGKSAKSVAATKPAKPSAANLGTSPRPLPKDWQAIDIGQLVLAKADGPWSSWWEAVPVETIDESRHGVSMAKRRG
jgi:hypothetical protein